MEKGMDKFSDEFDNKNENLNQDNFVSEEKIRERMRKIENFIKSLNAPKDIEEKYLNNLRDGMNDIQNRKESEYEKSLKEYNEAIEKIESELDGIIKQGVLHHIQGDESLSDICSKYYGDGNISKLLMELGYKQVLTPGSLILLPKQLGDIQIQDKYKHLDPYKQFELFENGQGLYYSNELTNNQLVDNSTNSPKTVEVYGDVYEITGIISIEEINKIPEKIAEFIQTPRGEKIKLIIDTLNIYNDYLKDYNNGIEFKGIRSLGKELDEYIFKLENVIIHIQTNLTNTEYLTNDLLKSQINEIIDYGKGINSIGFGGVQEQLGNLQSFLSGIVDSEKLDIKQAQFEMLKMMRNLDTNDNSGDYNISRQIKYGLLDDVLNNEDLNKDGDISKRFHKIKEVFENPEQFVDGLVEAFQNKTLNWTEVMGEFYEYKTDDLDNYLIKNGIDIKGGLNQIKEFLDNRLGEHIVREIRDSMKQAIEDEWKHKGFEYDEDKLNKAVNDTYKEYEYGVKQQLINFVKGIGIKRTIKAFPNNLEQARANDLKVDMYSNIEGLGNRELSDEKLDSLKGVAKELAIQIALMYVSGSIGNLAAKGVSVLKGWQQVNTLGRVATIGAVDGSAFHFSYNILHNIRQGNEWYSNLDNPKEWVKDILFITALRALNSLSFGVRGDGKTVLDTVEDFVSIKGDKLVFQDKVWNIIGVKGISIGLETATLVGLGSGINIMFGDGIINDTNEIIHIISMVIGLRMVNKGIGQGNYLVKKVNGQLEVQQLKKVETSLKENKDIVKNVNSQVQSGEYITTTDKRGGKTKSNSPDNLVAEKEANIKSLEAQKKDIETKMSEKDRPPNTGNERPILLGGMIPLSQLFESGTELQEYEKVRDTLINEALTKQGAQNLLNNTNFNIIKKEFIDNYLSRQSTQLIIEQNKRNINTVRKGLEQDFDNMIVQLGGVEQSMKNYEGDELERKKQAIKEMFMLDEDKRLGEVLVGMVDEYYNRNPLDLD